jgi:hypothetical protein
MNAVALRRRAAVAAALLAAVSAATSLAATAPAAQSTASQLVPNGSFSSGLRGWSGTNALLRLIQASSKIRQPRLFTRIVVQQHPPTAGIETNAPIATNQQKGARIVAHASIRRVGPGGVVCLRVREFHGAAHVGTKTQCARAEARWQRMVVGYRLQTARSHIGVTVFRKAPGRGTSFDVAQITATAGASVRGARQTDAPGLLIGISANSQAWDTHAGTMQDRVAALGIHWLREEFTRSGAGTFDHAKWDAVFGAAAARHMTILPLFTDPSDYEDTGFVAAAVARYGPGGTFWQQHRGLSQAYAAVWWEVGNEPWTKGQTPARYANDFKAAVTAGRNANSRAKFLVAAYSTWKDPATGNWEPWVTPMYTAVPDLGNYVDGWTDHPYGNAPDDWNPTSPTWGAEFQQFRKVHDEFAAHGAGSAPMWVTEFGYATSGDRSVSEQQQATYLTMAANILATVPYARAFFIYQLQDWGPRDGDREHWFGITNADGSPKPAYAAVQALAAAANAQQSASP